jgi:hypothetical protein
MPRSIRFAFNREDGHVISRVGNVLAWPILDFQAIGKNGDYTQPFQYNLEKIDVLQVGREWDSLYWTKYIPTEMKNIHRKYWGMKPLPVEVPTSDFSVLCKRNRSTCFFSQPGGIVGFRHGSLYFWYKKYRVYKLLAINDTRNGAKAERLPQAA